MYSRHLVAACLLTASALGQTPPSPAPAAGPAAVSKPSPPAPWPLLETLAILKEGGPAAPLAAWRHLGEARQRALDDAAFSAMYFDILATVDSLVGDHRAALDAEREYFARAEPRVKTPAD